MISDLLGMIFQSFSELCQKLIMKNYILFLLTLSHLLSVRKYKDTTMYFNIFYALEIDAT